MDNTSSANASSKYNFIQQQQNQFTIDVSPVEKPNQEKIIQNDLNQNLYAANPVSNSQSNNQAQPYYNPNIPPNSYPYNPNIPPNAYPYNPNIPPNAYPYNPNIRPIRYLYNPNNPPPQGFPYYSVSSESFPNNGEVGTPQQLVNPSAFKCLIAMLLIMSILMFTFVIIENIVLYSKGKAFKNGFIIADDIGILICAILFIISSILAILKKNIIILSIIRTVITVIVWIVGLTIRSIGMGDFDDMDTFFTLLTIRGILLFMAIPVSAINATCRPNL